MLPQDKRLQWQETMKVSKKNVFIGLGIIRVYAQCLSIFFKGKTGQRYSIRTCILLKYHGNVACNEKNFLAMSSFKQKVDSNGSIFSSYLTFLFRQL
jgi:hypothetical protein